MGERHHGYVRYDDSGKQSGRGPETISQWHLGSDVLTRICSERERSLILSTENGRRMTIMQPYHAFTLDCTITYWTRLQKVAAINNSVRKPNVKQVQQLLIQISLVFCYTVPDYFAPFWETLHRQGSTHQCRRCAKTVASLGYPY